MQITVRQLKSLIREAIMNEGGPPPEMERMIAKIAGAESRRQQYSISFDVAEENRDKIKKN